MTDLPADPAQLSRRKFLVQGAAVGAGLTLPQVGGAVGTGTHDLHLQAAARARALAKGGQRSLRLLAPDGSQANLRPVMQAFFEMTCISVEAQITGLDQVNAELLLDEMLGTRRFDLALPATFSLPDLYAAGVLAGVDPFAARHEPPGFREGCLYTIGDRIDGKLHGFQTDGDAYLMFYHKDLLEDPDLGARYADRFGHLLGVPVTWEELDRQMAYFHAPEKGRFGGLLYRTPGYLAWEWWARFHAKGVWPFGPDMTPQIAGDAGIAALEDMIRAAEALAPEARSISLFENFRRYARGDICANIGWGGTQKYLNGPASSVRGRLRFGPTPGGVIDGVTVQVPYFNWGWSYVVTAASPLPELAYLFALFASTPEMSTRAVRQVDGYFDPFRPEHYADPGIKAAYSDAFLQTHRAALEGAIPDLYLPAQSDYFSALSSGLDRALSGEGSARDSLRRVGQKWELITSRKGRTVQAEAWANLRQKYPEPLRTLLRDL